MDTKNIRLDFIEGKPKLCIVVEQGTVIIEKAAILSESENMVCIEVETINKWNEVTSYCHVNENIHFYIDYMNTDEKGQIPTIITFPRYAGWQYIAERTKDWGIYFCLAKDIKDNNINWEIVKKIINS